MNKEDLMRSITTFYNRLDSYNDSLCRSSILECIESRNTLYFKIINGRLAKIEAELNKNSSLKGFITELAVSLIFGPVLGHIVEFGLKRVFSTVINSRKVTIDLFKSIEAESLKKGRKGYKELKSIVKSKKPGTTDPELDKILDRKYAETLSENEVIYKRKKDFNDYASKQLEKLNSSVMSQSFYEYLSPAFFNDLVAAAAPAMVKFTAAEKADQGFSPTNSGSELLVKVNTYADKVRAQNYRFQDMLIKFVKNFELSEDWIDFLGTYYELCIEQVTQSSELLAQDKADVKFLFMALIFISTYGPPLEWIQVNDKNGNPYYKDTAVNFKTEPREPIVYIREFVVNKNIDKEVYNFLLRELKGHKILDGLSFYEFYAFDKVKRPYPLDYKASYTSSMWGTFNDQNISRQRISDPLSPNYNTDEYVFFKLTDFLDKNIYKTMEAGQTSIEILLSKYRVISF